MYRFITLLITILTFSLCAEEATMFSFPETTLTLPLAKKLALLENPTKKAAAARLRAASARLEGAQADYRPMLNFHASARHTEEIPGISIQSFQTYRTGLELSWKLYDGLARKYQKEARAEELLASEEQLLDVQRNLLLAVSYAYYEALLAKERMKIARQDAVFNQELLEETRKKFQFGAGARSDVLNFEIRTSNAESRYLEASLSHRLSYLILAELLGLEPEKLPEETSLGEAPETTEDYEIPELNMLIKYALEQRPDLKASQAMLASTRAGLATVEAGDYPNLNFVAGYAFQRDDSIRFGSLWDEAYLGLVLNWNLFDGGIRRAKKAEIAAILEEQNEGLHSIYLQIVNDVASKHASLQQAKEIATIQIKTEKLSEEVRNLVRKEYDQGRVTLTRLNEVQTDLTEASGQRAQAVIRFWQNREALAAETAYILE